MEERQKKVRKQIQERQEKVEKQRKSIAGNAFYDVHHL